MDDLVVRRLFSVDEYERMVEGGILDEDDRVELIEGEIVEMAAVGPRHAYSVTAQLALFHSSISDRAVIRVQNPIRLERSEPEPDIVLAVPPLRSYLAAHPVPNEILLVVEVADSTVLKDRNLKIPIYGRSGIQETWLVNLVTDVVEVFRAPGPSGYAEHMVVQRDGHLSPIAFPDLVIAVADILG